MSEQKFATAVRRGRAAKPPLTAEWILDAALGLIRKHGVDAVALRQVAEQVETGPASLYAYFAGRDVLLEHVLDAAYGQVQLVNADDCADGWRGALAATIVNTIATLEQYPGLGSVALGTIPVLPGALRLAEHELTLMEAGGIPAERAALAIDLIAQFAASTAIERTVRSSSNDHRSVGNREQVHATYSNADAEQFPRIRQHAALLTAPNEQARRAFAIRVLIDGVEGSTH